MNNQLQKLQEKLYGWIAHRKEPLSYNTIQLAVKGLIVQYQIEMKEEKAWSNLFFPLLRAGVVYFYGQGKYSLSPTVHLIGKEYSLLVNTFEHEPTQNTLMEKPGPGQILLHKTSNLDTAKGTPVVRFNLTSILKRVPVLHQTVSTSFFERENTQRYRYKKQGFRWTDYPEYMEPTAGIYKYGEHTFSPKFLVFQGKHYEIPGMKENPDAYTLANLLDQLNRQRKFTDLTYHSQMQRLSITNPFFPIELEKLLYLNTVLAKAPLARNIERRSYHLSFPAYQQLNRIFHQKIPMR